MRCGRVPILRSAECLLPCLPLLLKAFMRCFEEEVEYAELIFNQQNNLNLSAIS